MSVKSWIPGLYLEWKNLNYYVPAKEHNNYNFWQTCQVQKDVQILNNGE